PDRGRRGPGRRRTARGRRDRRACRARRRLARLHSRGRLCRVRPRTGARPPDAAARRAALRGPPHPRQGLTTKKLILIVIDGLTPAVFERAVERGDAPTLALLAREGTYRRAVSTFPSLTPVCASSIATGAHPDVHRIPHLVWYHRDERRLIED